MNWRAILILLANLGFVTFAQAATVVYTDKATFLANTHAVANAPIPNEGTANYTPRTLGNLTFSSPSPGFWFGYGAKDWSARLPGAEIAINGLERLNVDINKPVHAFGFDFVEPEHDPNLNATFADSTFTVTLLNGDTTVSWFNFNAPNDQAYFVGVWSSTPFSRVQIREAVGQGENEFFGQFYTTAVPLPASAWAGLALLGTLASVRVLRRRMG